MTRHFGSLTHLAAHLTHVAATQHAMERGALEECAKLVETRAKAKLGEYQDAAPPFAGWADLADATKADRERQGFPEDDPLVRTGALRDSIGHTVADGAAHVGSNSDVAVYQELGTDRIPPRSFLGGAMAESLGEVRGIIGREAVAALVGEQVFNKRMRIG